MLEEKYKNEINEIIKYSALGYNRQLVTAAGGNVSMRCEDGILVTASGVSLREVTAKGILLVDMNGNILDNPYGLKPSKETGFHLAIYRERPEINAVFHVHPPYLTAFTVKGREFPRVTSSAKNKLGPAMELEPMRAGSLELAKKVEETVKNADNELHAIILKLHGVVTFDSNLEEAFNTAELMEDCARIAFFSEQIK